MDQRRHWPTGASSRRNGGAGANPSSIRSFAVIMALAMVAAIVPSTATHAKGAESVSAAEVQAAAERTQREVVALMRRGLSPDEIAAKTGLEVVHDPEESSDDDEMGTQSDGTDVTLQRPSVYWDSSYQYYVASARFEWDSTSAWNSDCGWGSGDCGGFDGIGISVSKPVNTMSSYSLFCDEHGGNCVNGWQEANSDYGIGRLWQDRKEGTSSQYVGHDGYVSMAFRTPSSRCRNFVAEMSHTWNSTEITGVTATSDGISYTWSSVSYKWRLTSPTRHTCV